MKGQQLFHSFLPGVTAAVLTTQPAWAGALKINGAQLASSPSVLTAIDSRDWVVDTVNMQLLNNNITAVSVPTLLPAPGLMEFSVKPLSNKSIPAIATANAGVTIKQLLKKDKGKFFSLTPATYISQRLDVNGSTQSNQKQSNLGTERQNLENVATSRSTAKPSSTLKEILSLSSSQQPVVQKNNNVTQLQTFLQTSATGAGAAKLLAQQRCQQESKKTQTTALASLLTSSSCTQQNTAGVRVVQSNTPTPVETAVPAGTVQTPTTSPTVTPTPAGTVQIPNNLTPNPNPLQFPTKPEEVRLQENQPITLAQALELARRNNRDLQVALLQLERSQGALREAQAALYPTASVSTDITRSRSAQSQLQAELQAQQTGLPAPSVDSSTNFTAQAQLSYNIYTSGRSQASIRGAEEQVRLGELTVETQSEEIRLNVATDYYNLQQADQQVRIAQSAVQNAQASLRDAQSLERAGVGTRFDVLRSQVNLANAQQDLTNAVSQQQIARRQLATRINLAQSVNISAADPVQLAGLWNQTLEQSIVLAFQNRSELQQQLAQRNISEQQRRQALADLGPQVSLVASYNLLDQFDDNVSVTDGYSVGVRASLNLFDGGAARARAAQARANIAIAETQFAQQRNQIRFQVEQAFSNQQANLENVQTSNVALEQAREALRLARLRFQAGVGTQTDVINSENDLTRAEGNRVRAILDYNRALAQLQRAISFRALR